MAPLSVSFALKNRVYLQIEVVFRLKTCKMCLILPKIRPISFKFGQKTGLMRYFRSITKSLIKLRPKQPLFQHFGVQLECTAASLAYLQMK